MTYPSLRTEPVAVRHDVRPRLSFLLPALALLLGALGLFAPAPAAAQTTALWEATLTTKDVSGSFGTLAGCDNAKSGKECSDTDVLTEDSFTVGGSTYSLEKIYTHSAYEGVSLFLSANWPLSDLSGYQFCVGTRGYPIIAEDPNAAINRGGVASTHPKQFTGRLPRLLWSSGQSISLSIRTSCGTVSSDARLTSLESSYDQGGGVAANLPLTPAFNPNTLAYSAGSIPLPSNPNAPSGYEFALAVSDAAATVTLTNDHANWGTNPVHVAIRGIPGTGSGKMSVYAGANTLSYVVTAEDGTTRTYKVKVRLGDPPSTDATLSGLTATSSTSSGGTFGALTLTPDFAAGTTAYSASVGNDITHVKLTPTVTDAGARVKIGKSGETPAAVGSGSPSAAIALSEGANTINVEVTAEDPSSTETYTVTVTRASSAPSADATLSGLTATQATSSSGPFTSLGIGTFSASTTTYAVNVGNDVTHVKLTPTTNDAGATVEVGKAGSLQSVNSGSPSQAIALNVGANPIKVKVTAEDTNTTETYTVTVTRAPPPSTDATLSGLTATQATSSSGPFTSLNIGTFAASTKSYTASVANSITHVKLTPTVNDAGATVEVGKAGNLQSVNSGSPSQAIALNVGANPIKVEVTAEDAQTTGTYTVTVTRAATTPAAPGTPTLEAGNTQITASWTAPDDGGASITRYEVDYKETAATAWVRHAPSSTALTRTITGLTNNTSYDVRVRAVNSAGPGSWSSTASATPTPPPTVSLAVSDRVSESSSFMLVRVVLSAPLGNAVTIPIAITLGTAESDDISHSITSLRIPAGSTAAQNIISLVSDADTDDETFTVALGTPLPQSVRAGSPSSVTVTIVDDDKTTVNLTASSPVTEGSPVTVRATLSSAATSAVAIPVTVTRVTSESGDHGTLSSITVASGQTYGEGTITTAQDADTDDETFRVALGTLPAAVSAGAQRSVDVTITDDDTATQSTDARLSGLTATSAAGATGTFSALTLTPAFAAATESYSASVTNSITHVKITPTVNHSGASVKVGKGTSLSAVSSGSPSAAIALSEGANAITVEVTAEDMNTKKTYTVTVTRAAAQTQSTDATLSGLTATQSASSSGPFTPLGIGTFAAATTSYTVNVANGITHVKLTPTVNDASASVEVGKQGQTLTAVSSGTASAAIALSEGTNPITVKVTAQDGTTTGTYTVTVTRVTPPPTAMKLTATPMRPAEGSGVTLTVELDEPAQAGGVKVAFTVLGGTAIPGADYRLSPRSECCETATKEIEIAAGERVATATVRVLDDGEAEDAETIEIEAVANAPAFTVGVATITLTIPANGAGTSTPRVTLSATSPVDEGSDVTVTAELSRALAGDVTIPLTLSNGSAEDGDYATTLTEITIPGGQTEGTGTVATNQDADTDDETFTVALGASLPASVTAGTPSSVLVTITDDDTPTPSAVPTVSVSATTPVNERNPVTVTVTLSGALAGDVTIPLTVTAGTAEPNDYGMLESITITIPGGQTKGTGLIGTNRDDDLDDDTFTVALDTANLPSSVTAGTPSSVLVTIRDYSRPLETPTVTLSATPAAVWEGSPLTVRATLSSAATSEVVIPLSYSDDSADSGDYDALASITIASGATFGAGTIATNQDADFEDETFTVALGNLPSSVTAGNPSSVLVTIVDYSRPRVTLSASPNPVAEGSPVTVTAELSSALAGAFAGDVTIPLTLTPGTAETDDYGTLTSITIPSGQTEGRGTVATNQDADFEDETFTVALGTPLPVTVAAGTQSSVVVRITDDDTAPRPTVTLSATTPVAEGSDVTVTAELSYSPAGVVTIPVVLTPGTAETNDYGTLASITIPEDELSGTGTLATNEDADTDDETFTVALGAPLPSSVTAGGRTSVVVTILDDDTPPPGPPPTGPAEPTSVTVTAAPTRPAEGSTATLTATLDQPAPAGGVKVGFSAFGGTAFAGSDYTLSPRSECCANSTADIPIAEGARVATATLEVLADGEAEGDETIEIEAVANAVGYTVGFATITLTIPASPASKAQAQQEGPQALPEGLGTPFPTPFNAEVTVPFALSEAGAVHLAVYNLMGQPVRVLTAGWLAAGMHRVRWDGRTDAGAEASSGVYLVVLQTGAAVQTAKLALIR